MLHSTLVRLSEDDKRRTMYLDGTVTNNRLNSVLDKFHPLSEIDTEADEEELRAAIRNILRDELDDADHTHVQ